MKITKDQINTILELDVTEPIMRTLYPEEADVWLSMPEDQQSQEFKETMTLVRAVQLMMISCFMEVISPEK